MGATVMDINLPYLVEDRDRHGNVRLYVRLPGRKKVRIRERPGTQEFLKAYEAAAGAVAPVSIKTAGLKPGSFRLLCALYYDSIAFRALDISTQSWERRALDSICHQHGDKPAAMMESKHVRKIREEKRATPAAANHRLKALRALFSWAVEEQEGWIERDPTLGVKAVKYVVKGHHTWTQDEINQFQDRYPLGTKARLALDILRFTSCRREDVVRIGRQHIRNNRIQFRQGKNEHRSPVDIDIPLHPELAASIEAAAGDLTLLVTEFGRPFTTNGFGNKFKDWCRQAGLPHCSAHGVRKATASDLAENEATPHEIMAITGHQTLEEVERYTRAARRKKMADTAMLKLKGRT